MSIPLPHPSSRLLRAAAAEAADLARHRERLNERRDALLAEVRQLDDALAVIAERLTVLGSLTGAPEAAGEAGRLGAQLPVAVGGEPRASEAASEPEGELLRGPAIREIAVKVIGAQPERIEAIHYRRWFELLRQAGYAVAGKDPQAVFLTQVTRSPVVRKATKPGVYEIDRQAPLRIRQRLERLQAELRELTAAPASGPVDLAAVRSRRHELDLAISQQERALEEALRVLGADSGDAGMSSTGARAAG